MHQELFDFLYEYMEENDGLDDYIRDEIYAVDDVEDKLSVLIGYLCIPENGGIEMVMDILRAEFDREDFEEIVFSSFDIYF